MSLVGRLMATLGLDSRGFNKGLNDSEGRLKRFSRAVSKVGGGLSIVSAGMLAAIRNQLNAADELSKSAQRLGVPIEDLSALRHAADMSGVGVSDLDNSLRRLSRNMEDAASGGKKTSALFDQLGISVTSVDGSLRPTSEVMADAADRLSKMPDGARKTALAFELFGRSGTNLIPMLNGGRDSLQAMMQEARDLGLVLDAKTGKSAENFNDNVSRLSKTVRGLSLQASAALAPALEAVTDRIVQASKWFRDLPQSAKQALAGFAAFLAVAGPLALAVAGVAFALSTIAGPIVAVGAGIASLVAVASGLGLSLRTIVSVAGAVATAFGVKLAFAIGSKFVVSLIAATRQAVALELALGAKSRAAAVAGVAINGLTRGLQLLRGAIVATGIGALVVAVGLLIDQFIKLVQHTGGVGAALSFLWNVAKEVFSRIGLAGAAAATRLRAVFLSFQAVSIRLWANVVRVVVDAAEAIVDAGAGAAEAVKASFSSIPGALGDFMFQAANSVIDGVEEMINAVVRRVNKFIGSLNNALAKLPAWAGGGSLSIGAVDEVSLGGVGNPFSGQADALRNAAQDAFAAEQGRSDFGNRSDELLKLSSGIDASAAAARTASSVFLDMATAPLSSLDGLQSSVEQTEDKVDDTSGAVRNLQEELEALGDGGGSSGGGGGKAKKGKSLKEKLTDPFKRVTDSVKQFSDSLAGAIVQGNSLGDAMRIVWQRIAQDLISSGLQKLIGSVFGFGSGGSGALLSGVWSLFGLPSFANGTMNHKGGVAQVFERGGEILDLPKGTRVIPNDLSRMMVTAAGKRIGDAVSPTSTQIMHQEVTIRLAQSSMRLSDDGKIVAEIGLQTDRKIGDAARRADQTLPEKVQQIQRRPRDRGR